MSDLAGRLEVALTGRYAIERELGHGGTALVFLGRDPKHERVVAIKVLRPELAVALGAERFLREIKLTARLNHPHILPLLDSGEAAGFLYYVMPYVEGESLRDRLVREPQLPVEEALIIAREVADALEYAHQQGVVHRDIKPENILISAGHAVVADFGIARAIQAAGAQTVTQTGMLLGTPAYMSPEQAAGESELDGRSDIYSLGCVLYEMWAGAPPFTGLTAQAVIAMRFTHRPPEVSSVRDGVPVWGSRAVARALARDPAERYATAAQLAAALIAPEPGSPAEREAPTDKSIAVLPFTNMSSDPEIEYFGDGIAEEIINALAQLPGLRVAGRSSAFSFKGKREDLRVIGDKLSVGTVLEGSVRKAGAQLRITAQLVNVADGYHLWSERFDREPEDVFAIQEEIARTIAERLQVSLAGSDQMTLRPTSSISRAVGSSTGGGSPSGRRSKRSEPPSSSIPSTRSPPPAWPTPIRCWACTVFSVRATRSRTRGPPRGGPSSWAPSSPRPTMPWRACGCGIGTGPAPTGSSARHCSSTRATCKRAAGTGCSTCSGCTAGMRRGLRRRRARSK